MFSRNFWFVRSKGCFDVFLWNLPFAGRSIISRWLICDPHRRMTKKIVAGLRTSARIMPKRGKVTRSTEQTLLKNKHEAGVIESAISLTKDGQISVRVLAKPGAKQSNITGKNFYENQTTGVGLKALRSSSKTKPPRWAGSVAKRPLFGWHRGRSTSSNY